MNCPACERSNPDGSAFCGYCGSSLAQELGCSSCGASNPADLSFCRSCGNSLGTSEPSATQPEASNDPITFASGRYTVVRFLGEGAKKKVYLARDTRLDRDVAVALIKTEGLDAEGRERVRREAEAMGRLGDHPNIVTVYDVVEEGEQILIVSQYMPGGDIDRVLADSEGQGLPIPDAERIAAQLCRALDHAHGRSVIHRDLKPGNVYLAEDGSVGLGDFGLALSMDQARLTQEGLMVGTALYMPPEQALGKTPDTRSDLYALGAMVYELVAGRPPFIGDDSVSVISQHINTAPVAPSWHNAEVPPELESLILRLLAKDPDERPENAREVAEEFEALMATVQDGTADANRVRINEAAQPASLEFVGRDGELEQLKTELDSALSGGGSLVMVVGEPGIGKTRLTEQFSVHAKLRGAQVLSGRCYEGNIGLPYLPFVEALRGYVLSRENESLRDELGSGAPEVAAILSEVRQRIPDIGQSPALEGDAERLRLFESLTVFLQNASNAKPLVLVLDDLHWADKPSLLLLQHLARRIRHARILVIGTYRDIELERTHALSNVLTTLRNEHLYERVLLRGLSKIDVQELISTRAGHEAPTRFVETVFRETEGNPFFIEEVLRHLAEIGAISRSEGRWVGNASLVERSIPEGVREVIGRRLSRLSESCNAMLTIAAALPGGFSFEFLARMSEESEEDLLDTLDEALRNHVIRERASGGPGQYEFEHALIRQTLYGELSTPRRVRLHRKIAEELERLYDGRTEAHLSELAYHFFQAAPGGDVERAIDYAMRAAQRASVLLAYEEAGQHYERVLQLLEMQEAPTDAQTCALLLKLGAQQMRAGELDSSRSNFLRAIEVARTLDLNEMFGEAVLGLDGGGATIVSWNAAERLPLIDEALRRSGENDSPLRARLLASKAAALMFEDARQEREELANQAVAMAQRLGDVVSLADALSTREIIQLGEQPADDALAMADHMLKLCKAAGDTERTLWAHGWRVLALLRTAQRELMDLEIDLYERQAQELRQPSYRWQAGLYRGMQAMLDGRFDDYTEIIERTREIGEEAQEPLAQLMYGAQLFTLARERQEPLIEQTPQFVRLMGEHPIARSSMANSYAEENDEIGARREFEALATQGFANLPRDVTWISMMIALSYVCTYLQDKVRAAELYDLMRPYHRRIGLIGPGAVCSGSFARHVGMLATLLGRYDEASGFFDHALDFNTRLRTPVYIAHTELEYARMLHLRDQPGDAEAALERVNHALEAGRELGMGRLVPRALSLKLELQGVEPGEIKSSIFAVASTIGGKRPDFSPHSAPDGSVTLMFSDMEGFTEMTERLGDQRALEVIQRHNRIVRQQLAMHEGHELELQGDGFLLAFAQPMKALRCAVAIQRAFDAHNRRKPVQLIRVRIGLHTGEAIKDADKFFGRTVILAARIAAQARGGEILVSSALREFAERTGDLAFSPGRDLQLKGISQPQRVFALNWS